MTAPIIQNGSFTLDSLKAFAEGADKNAKVLVNQNTGTVSIKGAITSRLPGTMGARLEAAHLFLETLKKEYGETIALELSKDADVASLQNGKPLSARRIQNVLARAEARLQQLEGRIQEAEHLIHEFGSTATIKKFGEQFGESLSMKTFFPEIKNAEKMVKDLKAILDQRDERLATKSFYLGKPNLTPSAFKEAGRNTSEPSPHFRVGLPSLYRRDFLSTVGPSSVRPLLTELATASRLSRFVSRCPGMIETMQSG